MDGRSNKFPLDEIKPVAPAVPKLQLSLIAKDF